MRDGGPMDADPDQEPGSASREALIRELGVPDELGEVIGTLLELGVTPDAIRRAHATGRLEDAIFEPVLGPVRAERTVSPSEIEADGGLQVAETQLMALNFGLPAPEPDEPFFTPEEAWALKRVGQLRELWPPEVYLQIARVYGQALARVAEAEVHAFRNRVEARLKAESGGTLGALPAVHEAFGELLPLADPLLLGVHRRRVEHEIAQAAVREAERQSPAGVLPGAVEVTLAFCDLKDFTAYAETHGDAAAVEVIEGLATVITSQLGEHGHVVKALGDGYMLSFREPADAVSACLGVIERMRSMDTLGIHASVHHGVALVREGDYFGRTVNLAARLLGVAGQNELVATATVARATEGLADWTHGGSQRVRGVSDPVDIYRTSPPSGPASETA